MNTSLRPEILFLTKLQIQIIIKLLNIFSGLMGLGSIPTCPPTSLDPPQECFKEEIKYNLLPVACDIFACFSLTRFPCYLITWKRLIARCCYDAVSTLVYSLYAFQLSINSQFLFSSFVIVIINYADRNKNYCNLIYFSSLHFFLLLTGPPRLTIAILRGQSIVKLFLLKKVEV